MVKYGQKLSDFSQRYAYHCRVLEKHHLSSFFFLLCSSFSSIMWEHPTFVWSEVKPVSCDQSGELDFSPTPSGWMGTVVTVVHECSVQNTYHGSKGRTMRQGSELCLHSFRWSDRGFGLVVLKSVVCYQTKPNSDIKSIWKNRRELTTRWKLLACINYPFRRSLTLIVVSKVLPSLSSD